MSRFLLSEYYDTLKKTEDATITTHKLFNTNKKQKIVLTPTPPPNKPTPPPNKPTPPATPPPNKPSFLQRVRKLNLK